MNYHTELSFVSITGNDANELTIKKTIPDNKCSFLLLFPNASISARKVYRNWDFEKDGYPIIFKDIKWVEKRKRYDSVQKQRHRHQHCQKGKVTKHITPQKNSIIKRLIADRLKTVSLSNYSHPTGVVHRFTGLPSNSPQQPCNHIKETHLKICKWTSIYKQQTNSHTKQRGN